MSSPDSDLLATVPYDMTSLPPTAPTITMHYFSAQELKQDWPVDSAVYLEDMTWDQGNDTPCTPNADR